jgi:hypothetical protein
VVPIPSSHPSNHWFRGRRKQQPATWHDYPGDAFDEAALVLGRKQED